MSSPLITLAMPKPSHNPRVPRVVQLERAYAAGTCMPHNVVRLMIMAGKVAPAPSSERAMTTPTDVTKKLRPTILITS